LMEIEKMSPIGGLLDGHRRPRQPRLAPRGREVQSNITRKARPVTHLLGQKARNDRYLASSAFCRLTHMSKRTREGRPLNHFYGGVATARSKLNSCMVG
jgi:hypothetical protein